MMENKEELSDKIVIVGSRHGDLADVVMPLFEKAEAIEGDKNIVDVLGGVEVILSPRPNKMDGYAVGVYTRSQRLLGFVWMYQSAGVSQWIGLHDKRFVKARITRIVCPCRLIMAQLEKPMKLYKRENESLDMEWANDLPDMYPSIKEQSLSLGIDLLEDALEGAVEWTPLLQMSIDNVLDLLPLDLSANNYRQSIGLYMKMIQSPVKEVREHGELILSAMVSRGSEVQMTWWAEQWLPASLRLEGQEMLGVFEAADYTVERIEKILSRAPENLFYVYKADRKLFANRLYYAALPQVLYRRLLTLLAVREAMLAKEGIAEMGSDKEACAEELFHFIHPEVEHDEALRIHQAMKRAVAYQRIPEICAYLRELKQKGKVMLPPSPNVMYNELVRLGMPTGKGYTEKNFGNSYMK